MCWKPVYIILIFISTVADYFLSLKLGSIPEQEQRKPYLWVSLFLNLGLLFVFKYFNFFNESFSNLFYTLNIAYAIPALNVLLPVGISFYTFQTMSYSIDVYNGKIKPEKHFGIFALFVSFFPQLVAGPIERAGSLLGQFKIKQVFNYDVITSGLRLIAWGFFKKIVIADRLALIVDTVYSNPSNYEGISLIITSVLFAIQIYCDFSGYSDIAIGSARVLGIKLMLNFDRPYISTSITEMWRRWHISLSNWIKDYLSTPLMVGTRNWGKQGIVFSLFVTFLLMGLWHGAAWTFVVFGALHGIALVIEFLLRKTRKRLSKRMPKKGFQFLAWLYTISFWSLSLVFFRSNSINEAIVFISNIFTGLISSVSIKNIAMLKKVLFLGTDSLNFIIAIIFILALFAAEWLQGRKGSINAFIIRQSLLTRWSFYICFVFVIFLFGVNGKAQFIYFQF